MTKKILSYLLLIIISTQISLAGIDMHMLLEDAPKDIVHHYIEIHSQQDICKIDPIKNLNNSADDVHNSIHHGCSGHITYFISNHIKFISHSYKPTKIKIQKRNTFVSVNHSPLFKPPIS